MNERLESLIFRLAFPIAVFVLVGFVVVDTLLALTPATNPDPIIAALGIGFALAGLFSWWLELVDDAIGGDPDGDLNE